jgi:hypothetical protein
LVLAKSAWVEKDLTDELAGLVVNLELHAVLLVELIREASRQGLTPPWENRAAQVLLAALAS